MYPSKKQVCTYGFSLVATCDVEAGTVVQKFEGPIYAWKDVPENEVCHAILFDANRWMVASTDARYANHSCDPNCMIDDLMRVVTTRAVRKGDQYTFSYNVVAPHPRVPDNDATADNFWDPRWSFRCECGAEQCQGVVDKYVLPSGEPWVAPI